MVQISSMYYHLMFNRNRPQTAPRKENPITYSTPAKAVIEKRRRDRKSTKKARKKNR